MSVERYTRTASGQGEPSPGVCLRLATRADEASLLALRNEPVVREFSFSREIIEPDVHRSWLERKLNSPAVRIWVAVQSSALLGMVRYEKEGEAAVISFAVAAHARGQGLGTWLLSSTWAWAIEQLEVTTVRGIVMAGNEASARAFLKAGYSEVGNTVYRDRDSRIFERLRARSPGDPLTAPRD